jgi:hypothetical protein
MYLVGFTIEKSPLMFKVSLSCIFFYLCCICIVSSGLHFGAVPKITVTSCPKISLTSISCTLEASLETVGVIRVWQCAERYANDVLPSQARWDSRWRSAATSSPLVPTERNIISYSKHYDHCIPHPSTYCFF